MSVIKNNVFDLTLSFLNYVSNFFSYIGCFINKILNINVYGIDYVNLSYGATSLSENILKVYNFILFIEVFLIVVISWIFLWILIYFKDNSIDKINSTRYKVYYSFYKNPKYFTSKLLEFLWTIFPIGILILIGYPSLVLLYLSEERINPEVIVKVIGHQWYWSYENENGECLDICMNDTLSNSSSLDEYYELVQFNMNSSLFKLEYPLNLNLWLNSFYAIKELSYEEINSIFSLNCLFGDIKHLLYIAPFINKEFINLVYTNKQLFYNYIVDYTSVSNENEFLATNVLQKITDLEVTSSDSLNLYNKNILESFQPFYWIERAFNSFDYKYLWLDIDVQSDFLRYLNYNNMLSNNKFKNNLLDGIVFDSYLLKDYDLLFVGEKRLLEVDNRLILPSKTHIQLIVTSVDVIHSFSVPAFGIKIDAIPGRLNQCYIFSKFEGVFFGQCSELCGVDHGYMPIVIEMVSYPYYFTSIKSYLGHYKDVYYTSGWETLLSR